jgi:hypothetical protein
MPIVKPEVSLTAYTFKSELVLTEYCIELASTPALCLVGSEFKSQPINHYSNCCQCGGSHCLKVIPYLRSKLISFTLFQLITAHSTMECSIVWASLNNSRMNKILVMAILHLVGLN